MEGTKKRRARSSTNCVGAVGLLLGSALWLSAGGCTDHRISLTQFLEMQQEAYVAEPTTQPAELQEQVRALVDRQLGPYRVGPSDELVVTLTGTEEAAVMPPVEVRVDRDGRIDLPLVGAISVAALEIEDVEDAVKAAFVPNVYRSAVVHVSVVEPDTTNVLVHGAVTLPGLVHLRRTERNLLFAIVAAGGISDIASGRVTLRRIRHPDEEVTLELTEPEELHAALALAPLEDGDIVHVEAATPNTIYTGGLLNAPRPQVLPPGANVTVLQAIAASGGLRTDVTPREATLIRRMPDGQDVHVKLDLDRVTTGEDPNILLAAGDILWVPDTIETRVQDFVNRNFFIRAGVVANVSYDVTGIEFLNRRSLQGARYGDRYGADIYDPYGSLIRNYALQSLATAP
ncbi:MAG: polysaccharide biosynthesis/export family protein [Phycisphaerales bacterium]|nr:MAG: polysaccharide biosynthesis/export family protein [Phycisphaerales bacterium]